MEPRDRENLLADLRSDDDEVRRLAVERLPELPAEEATPLLADRLGDPSWRVRKAAIERLAAAADATAAVRALVRALSDGDNPGRRNAALEALTLCGGVAVPALLEATADPDVDVRKQVVDALGGIGDPRSTPRLRELLRDPDPNVRGAAADALGTAGDASCGDDLLRAAREDPERLVRLSALRAVSRLEVPVDVEAVAAPLADPLLRPAVYALLGGGDDPAAVDVLRKGLLEGHRSSREAAALALVRQASRSGPEEARRLCDAVRETLAGDDAVLADLHDRLRDAPLARRLVLVQFLGLAARPESLVPLLEAGADEALAEVALASLLEFGAGIDELVDAAFDDLGREARRLAVELLGRSRGPAGERRLRWALAHHDVEQKAAAARALARRASGEAVPELVRELEVASAADGEGDEDLLAALSEALVATAHGADVAGRVVELLADGLPRAGEAFRAVAARILGEIGGPADAARIGFLLSDPSERVRRAAVEALGRVARGAAPEPLRLALADESPAVRIGAATAIAGGGDAAALDDLGRLAGDDDERVRAAVMRAVGACAERAGVRDDARVEAVLTAGLVEGGAVALAALEAMRALGGPVAVRLARPLLAAGDPELVAGAVECVGRHAEAAELPELFPLVSHGDWSVRARTVQTLAERNVERALPSLLRRLEIEQDEFVRDALLGALRRLER